MMSVSDWSVTWVITRLNTDPAYGNEQQEYIYHLILMWNPVTAELKLQQCLKLNFIDDVSVLSPSHCIRL